MDSILLYLSRTQAVAQPPSHPPTYLQQSLLHLFPGLVHQRFLPIHFLLGGWVEERVHRESLAHVFCVVDL